MISFATLSEKASHHQKNEDYILRNRHPYKNQHLCFLADGQGGRPDGEKASRLACEYALQEARTRMWEELALPSTWDEIFATADLQVREQSDGYTTLVGFALDQDGVSGASVGDSKLYFRNPANGEFSELSYRQNKNPPIGGGCSAARHFFVPGCEGTLIAMSDGVWKFCGLEAIIDCAAMEELDAIPGHLCETVRNRNSDTLPDDFTVLAVSVSAVK